MSKFAIRFLTLAIYATALVVVPMVTPAEAATNSTKEIRKNKKKAQKSLGLSDPVVCRSGVACCQAFPSGRRGLLPRLRVWEVASSNV